MNKQAPDLLNRLSQNQINMELITACRAGNLDDIKYLLTSPELTMRPQIHPDMNGPLAACEHASVDVVQYLLTIPELRELTAIEWNRLLMGACKGDNVDTVKYLLTSCELKEHAKIKNGLQGTLAIACFHSSLDVVKYLLTNHDVHSDIQHGLNAACIGEHIDTVKYLLGDLPTLDINIGLKSAMTWGKQETIHYLIFDYSMPFTPELKKHLLDNNHTGIIKYAEVENLFMTRENYIKLDDSLPRKTTMSKKNKL